MPPPPPPTKPTKPTFNPNPQPRARLFDVFNSASTGHQVADGGGARGREWRITRQEKLARQFGSRDGDCTSSPALTPAAAAAVEGMGNGSGEEEAGRGEWVFAATAAHSGSVCSGNKNNSNSNHSNNIGAGSQFGAAQQHSHLRSSHNGPRQVQWGVRASSSSASTGQMDIRNMLGGQVRKRGFPGGVSDDSGGGESGAIGMKKAKVQTGYSPDWATEIAPPAAAAVTTTTATEGAVAAPALITTSFKSHPATTPTPTPSITSTTTTTIKSPTTQTSPSTTSATTPSTSCQTIPPSLHTDPMNNKKIFTSLTIHINGQTTPLISDHALKRLLVSQGATLSLSLSRKITHVIIGVPNAGPGSGGAGGGLAATKIQKELQRGGWKGVKIVGVQWALDSIKAGKRLSEGRYAVQLRGRQRSVLGFCSPSSAEGL
ncbi:hypothetical protein BO86DRAFT_390984 [Aspergillus japonicus CBS 114.51]|uniref:BRCT domain-containing protein n=2 Tax=Aspergillus TaxID=5052 RepID=A0A2V5H3W0_ASPV1|nr:hypothetical protein BO86DRAFT_390984 [Aspergillus japonicus CBS 114.51]PYI15543.1 hypothetical protein BO99DRAFT_405787 [Aspergillus violaceofuscus CBS 115571]RAH79427.1 hypothetical protein BO86DRAFT_390984 [Aspergillus japonicus CBS 114.51]